jgi:hypothetical protein
MFAEDLFVGPALAAHSDGPVGRNDLQVFELLPCFNVGLDLCNGEQHEIRLYSIAEDRQV